MIDQEYDLYFKDDGFYDGPDPREMARLIAHTKNLDEDSIKDD